MEGVWKYNPFYRMALRRLNRLNSENNQYYGLSLRPRFSKQRKLQKLNPLTWSNRTIRTFMAVFFMIAIPIYTYVGLQPVSSIEAANYPNLNIPAIGLDTPVAALELVDHQLIAPSDIAGSYQPSDNKIFIIGHSSTVFKKLSQTQKDDIFQYNQENYQVSEIEVLDKNAINMGQILATSEEPTIIMMTCAGEPLPNQDATHRLIITAQKLID